MMRQVLWGAALAAMALATAAGAQERAAQAGSAATAVQVGRVIEGRVTGTETRYTLQLAANETVRIVARGREFDAMLKVYGATGDEPLAEDDDSGGGTTAELTFQAPRAGAYQIAVSQSGTAEESSGERAYDLAVLPAVAPVTVPPRAITANGSPVSVDRAQCGAGCQFTFQAREGERLVAETTTVDSATDPVLELRSGTTKLGEDDDGGDGLNSRLVRNIPRTGTYTLVARTVNGNGDGRFALNVSLRPHVARTPASIAVGTPATGTIGTDAELADDGKFYNAYTLRGRAGQHVVLDLESTEFDAELRVMGDSVLGLTELAMNDDAATDGQGRPRTLNSHLELTFARAGTVEVRAVSLNTPGRYTLRIADAPAR